MAPLNYLDAGSGSMLLQIIRGRRGDREADVAALLASPAHPQG
jgi:hypothetical protein